MQATDTAAFTLAYVEARQAGKISFRATLERDCPFCDATNAMLQDGEIATGLEIVVPPLFEGDTEYRYQPEPGEVLKNHYMVCRACGADQGS